MDIEAIKEIIQKGEGTFIEFKESYFGLPRNTFETICAFLNNKGGHLFLGIKDNGDIEGISADCHNKIMNNLSNDANNYQNLNPVFFLTPELIEYEGETLIYNYIPESPQVHRFKGRIYLRNGEKDFDITNNNQEVFELYLRKKFYHTEDIVIPEIHIDDFDTTSFELARKLVSNSSTDHPWIGLSNSELLKSSGLFRKNHFSGQYGFTLASVLLFGKADVINNILPSYKTELRFECGNVEYNEFLVIKNNLLNSFFQIKSFCEKHFLSRTYRLHDPASSRDVSLFDEIICNMLIHREYSNPYSGKLTITEDKIMTQNWNLPSGVKFDSHDYYPPILKNPRIASVFINLGLARGLGTGIKRLFSDAEKHTPLSLPIISESNIFITEVPLYDKEIPLFEVSNVEDLREDECIEFMLTITRDIGLSIKDQALPPYTIGYRINGNEITYIQILAADQVGIGVYQKELVQCDISPKTHRFEFEYINQIKNQIGPKKLIRYVRVYDIPVIQIQESESIKGLCHDLRAEYHVIHDYPAESQWILIEGPGDAIFTDNKVQVKESGSYTFAFVVINGPCSASSEVSITFQEKK